MRTEYKVETCPKCKKEFETEVRFLPLGGVDDSSGIGSFLDAYRCPLCDGLISNEDPEYKIRYIRKSTPVSTKTTYGKIKLGLMKILRYVNISPEIIEDVVPAPRRELRQNVKDACDKYDSLRRTGMNHNDAFAHASEEHNVSQKDLRMLIKVFPDFKK